MKTNHFFRLLARLRVGHKLLLIYLLDLSAVIYISGILIHEKYLAIDFSNREIVGNAYVRVVTSALIDVALTGAGQRLPPPHGARRSINSPPQMRNTASRCKAPRSTAPCAMRCKRCRSTGDRTPRRATQRSTHAAN